MMIFAHTPRLKLRALENSDLQQLVSLLDSWDIAQWMTMMPHPYKESDGQWFVNEAAEKYAANKAEAFALEEKESGKLIGVVGAHTEPEPQIREIGYWLGVPFHGKGYMTEALTTALPLFATIHDTIRFVATTDPLNVSSQNVLQKAGFSLLGTFTRTPKEGEQRSRETETRWEKTI